MMIRSVSILVAWTLAAASAAPPATPRVERWGRFEAAKGAFRPSFFQRLDRKVDRINEHGLVAAPVLLWALPTGSLFAAPVAGISYGANGVWPWLRQLGEPILNHPARPGLVPIRARIRPPLRQPYACRTFDPVAGEYLPGSRTASEPVVELLSPLPHDAVAVLTAARNEE